MLSDTFPVFNTRAAQRINAQRQTGFLNRRHINDIRQPFDKWLHQIYRFNVARGHCRIQRDALNALQAARQQRIGAIFYHFSDVGIRRAAIGRIIFNTAIFRRVVRRCNDNTICQRAAFFVMDQDSI